MTLTSKACTALMAATLLGGWACQPGKDQNKTMTEKASPTASQKTYPTTGSIDRLVLIKQAGRVVAADIIDFKTDDLGSGNKGREAKVEFYRPQLAAYKSAVARNYRLEEQQVAARLAFLAAGDVVDV